ncbi:cation transporting ATPase C-terminal domain-containing protein, partial [Mesorhizobium sp. M8A.F.Ca.ET.167.01.1.1]
AAVFLLGLDWGIPENELRALTFFALVVSIVGLVLVNRAFSASLVSALLRPNRALGAVIAIDSTVLGLVLLWPSANALFQFEPPRLSDLAAVLAAAVGLVALLELLKSL